MLKEEFLKGRGFSRAVRSGLWMAQRFSAAKKSNSTSNLCHSEQGRRPCEEPAVDSAHGSDEPIPRETGKARRSVVPIQSPKKETGLQPLRSASVGRALLSVAFDVDCARVERTPSSAAFDVDVLVASGWRGASAPRKALLIINDLSFRTGPKAR